MMSNVHVDGSKRFDRDDNEFGLQTLDHFAMPTLDVDRMVRFMVEVLGGEIWAAHGYDERDRELGRHKHVFVRIGNVLMQVAVPNDGKLKIGKDDPNFWPHWAFLVSAEDMDRNIERLRSLGIPIFGPVQHRGSNGITTAYFLSPDGHKLELVTYDVYPEDKILGISGDKGVGRAEVQKLIHDWPDVDGTAAA